MKEGLVMRFYFVGLILVLTAAAAPGAHAAASAKDLGTYGKWLTYEEDDGGKPVCYMAAKPTQSEGTYKARGDVFITVTHRPAQRTFDVVSVVGGYQYKQDSGVAVTVDKGKAWDFFTNADRAWSRDAATDKAVVKAMAKGTTLTVKGTSNRGTPTTDVFALSGFGKAYKAISAACKKPAK
jgi:invasion protein IalB